MKIVDLKKNERPIGSLPTIDQKTFVAVLLKAIKAIKENTFPKSLDCCV